MSKKGGKSVKIFRIMVLGRVEVGKTCLCMQYTSNNTPTIYEHTEQPNYYIRDIDINKFQSKIIEGLPDGAAGKGESKAKDKKKKKKKESNERYGVHLVDVPGEIETEVLANTPEYDNIRNKKPQKPNNTYYDIGLANEGEDVAEDARLLSRKSKHQGSRNRLFEATSVHGFIVMFDVSEVKSIEKCKNVCEEIRRAMDAKDSPIVLVSNKEDSPVAVSADEEVDVREEMVQFANGMEHCYFSGGSVLRNELAWEDESMAVDMWLHEFIKKVDELGLGDQDTGKKKRGGGGGGGEDDDDDDAAASWWCACCRAQPAGDDDGQAKDDGGGGGCAVM